MGRGVAGAIEDAEGLRDGQGRPIDTIDRDVVGQADYLTKA